MKPIINRWYTQSGKGKRVPEYLKPLKAMALENKPELLSGTFMSFLSIIKYIRRIYGLSLKDGLNFAVHFIGLYNNPYHNSFCKERYDAGEKVIRAILSNHLKEKK